MKVTGSLYGNVKEHLIANVKWAPGCKLGTTGHRGTLFLSNADDVDELYKVKPIVSAGEIKSMIESMLPALAALGIDKDKAIEFLDEAAAIIMTTR